MTSDFGGGGPTRAEEPIEEMSEDMEVYRFEGEGGGMAIGNPSLTTTPWWRLPAAGDCSESPATPENAPLEEGREEILPSAR